MREILVGIKNERYWGTAGARKNIVVPNMIVL
jgi:hypothetical protein